MTILGLGSILADIPVPVRSQITARLAELLAPIAPVTVGPTRGWFEESLAIYLTPGTERLTGGYGFATTAAQYSVTIAAYAPDYNAQPYEMADRLGAHVARRLAAPDAALSALIDGITLESIEPAFPEEPSAMIGATLSYTVTYAADSADPYTAI